MRNWIKLVESASQVLYHVTPKQNLEAILRDGINPTSYWAIEEVSDYYAENIEDNGDDYITFALPLARILSPIPDMPGIEEPVVFRALGKRETQVHAEWADSDKSWKASLEIIGSIASAVPIHVTAADLI
jgi:hypothetical protein